MRVHKPQGARIQGRARGHRQHERQASYPRCSSTSACTGPGRAEGGTGNPPQKKTTGKGGNPTHLRTGTRRAALSTPRAHTRRPGGAEESRRDSHTTAKPRTHSTEADNILSQATPCATPPGPTDRTPRDHPAQLDDAQPDKAAHHDYAAIDGPEEKTARARRHTPPPGKRQATDHGDADTTRTARKKITKEGGGGGERGDHGQNRRQQPPLNHNTTEPRTTPPPPRNRRRVLIGKARNKNPHHPKKRGGAPPMATPTQAPIADGTASREGQGQTTTKVEEGSPDRTGQASGTHEGQLSPHKTATNPSRGNTTRQAGIKGILARTGHGTARARTAGYKGSPYRHAPPANRTKKGGATSQPIPGHKPHPSAEKGGKGAIPLPSYPPPAPQPAPKHTHTKPQPEQARSRRNPHPPAHTASPGQGR